MLKNILNIENVQKIDKKHQKVINGGGYTNRRCIGDARCCGKCGFMGGHVMHTYGNICVCNRLRVSYNYNE